MNIIGVIPARSGSSEIKNKNIQKIKNETLLQISIKKLNILKKKKYITDFVVTTDSKFYSNLAKEYGSKVHLRPKHLSGNRTKIVEVLHYLKKYFKNDYFLTIVPTAPLISVNTIKKLIVDLKKKKFLSSGSISKITTIHPLLAMKKKDNNKYEYLINKSLIRYPRQVRPNSYFFNGCIFIRHKKLINKNNFKNNCLGKSFYGFEITRNESCNIDKIEDLNYCKKNFNAKKVYK